MVQNPQVNDFIKFNRTEYNCNDELVENTYEGKILKIVYWQNMPFSYDILVGGIIETISAVNMEITLNYGSHPRFAIYDEIEKLQKYATSKGFKKVVFRNRPMPTGDFCIFLYNDALCKNSYIVGYDGSWDAKNDSPTEFFNCVKSAYNFIDSHCN